MKKIWLLLLCCLLGGEIAAQSSIGFRGGKSLSRVNMLRGVAVRGQVQSPSQVFVDGYEGGLVIRRMSSPHLGLQAELNISRQGWHIFPNTAEAYQREFGYVQLPLLSHLQLGNGRFTFNVQAGAFLSYTFLDRTLIAPAEEAVLSIEYAHQRLLPWQYGLVGGAGPAYRFPFGIVQLEARFVQHLSHLLQADLRRIDDIDISQQQIITFGLQWVYTFK